MADLRGDLLEVLFGPHPCDTFHAAPPIVRVPGDDVDVDMKDLLSGRLAIIDPQIEPCRSHGRLNFCGYHRRHVKKSAGVFGWHLGKGGMVLSRNDQGVPRRAGKDVQEGDGPFLLKDRMGRSGALGNLAKEAAAHCGPRAFWPPTSMGTRSTT